MKNQIKKTIEENLDYIFDMAKTLYENPEISGHEVKSSHLLAGYLKGKGFTVIKPYLGEQNGFRAEYVGKPGPNIALFCEYDALPEIGHGCGHNLICTSSISAACALQKVVDFYGGTITVFGTPAEETNGVKGIYGDKGAYEGIDVGLMAHPDCVSTSSGATLALKAIEYEFFGKTSHAATAPEKGINALDAVILLFNGVNAIRQHVKSDVRIHGVINNGGIAANIVPDYASARFYIRSNEKEYLDQVEGKMLNIASGAAEMTGATMNSHYYELPYDNMVTNKRLSDIFDCNLEAITGEPMNKAGISASMDMGNVSHYIPAIHPMVKLGDKHFACHTKEMADETVTNNGKEYIRVASLALAFTCLEILENKNVLEEIQKEFKTHK